MFFANVRCEKNDISLHFSLFFFFTWFDGFTRCASLLNASFFSFILAFCYGKMRNIWYDCLETLPTKVTTIVDYRGDSSRE